MLLGQGTNIIIYIHTHIYTYVHICTCIAYTYIYIYTYVYIYMILIYVCVTKKRVPLRVTSRFLEVMVRDARTCAQIVYNVALPKTPWT